MYIVPTFVAGPESDIDIGGFYPYHSDIRGVGDDLLQ